jgi:hypothetical protein
MRHLDSTAVQPPHHGDPLAVAAFLAVGDDVEVRAHEVGRRRALAAALGLLEVESRRLGGGALRRDVVRDLGLHSLPRVLD